MMDSVFRCIVVRLYSNSDYPSRNGSEGYSTMFDDVIRM